MREVFERIREKARKAINKKAEFSIDLNLDEFFPPGEHVEPQKLEETAKKVGVSLSNTSGSYAQIDKTTIISQSLEKGLEIKSLRKALQEEDLLDYWWKIVPVDLDKYTAKVELLGGNGYFVRVREGKKVSMPVHTCLVLGSECSAQPVHNIIIVEPYAELTLLTGCTLMSKIRKGIHLGVTEIYVKEGGKVTYTMVHSWGENVHVRSRTGVVLDKNASFYSSYVNLGPVGSIQTCPTILFNGDNAKAKESSIILAPKAIEIDIGAKMLLNAKNVKGEIISRAVASNSSRVVSRGFLIGRGENAKGHLECRGIIMSESASIIAIPVLESYSPSASLTHEAAIGKIAEEEKYYLMARGLSEEEATAVLVSGFLTSGLDGIPKELHTQLRRVILLTAESSM